MSAPPVKPWERAASSPAIARPVPEWERGSAQSLAASRNIINQTASMAQSSMTSTQNPSSSLSAPQLPARGGLDSSLTPYGSRYGSSYGSRYGGYSGSYDRYGGYGGGYERYGGIGGSYGSYGGGYDRYSGGYGGGAYGGYGGGGYGGGAYGGYGGGYGSSLGRGALPPPGKDVGWMDSFHHLVETFGRFSRLLDANFDALFMSFSSVLRLFETLGHLRQEIIYILQAFAVLKALHIFSSRVNSVSTQVLGRDLLPASSTLDVSEFTNAEISPVTPAGNSGFLSRLFRPSPSMAVLVVLAGLLGPALVRSLWRNFSNALNEENKRESEGEAAVTAVALYDFRGESSRDLPFRAGEEMQILFRGEQEGWWVAELRGRRGEVPSTYVKIVERKGDGEVIK